MKPQISCSKTWDDKYSKYPSKKDTSFSRRNFAGHRSIEKCNVAYVSKFLSLFFFFLHSPGNRRKCTDGKDEVFFSLPTFSHVDISARKVEPQTRWWSRLAHKQHIFLQLYRCKKDCRIIDTTVNFYCSNLLLHSI